MRTRREFIESVVVSLPVLVLAGGCGTIRSARGNAVAGSRPVEVTSRGAYQVGLASWYGAEFAGRKTANGERFDPEEMTAAHRQLPFHTLVRVTNLENSRHITVRINDRGPFKRGRVIDCSRAAARELRFINQGLAQVRLDIVRWARG